MCKYNLRLNQYGRAECNVFAPAIAGLTIAPIQGKTSDEWGDEQINIVMTDLCDAMLTREVACDKRALLRYVQERLPGITEDYYLERYEVDLKTHMQEYYEAYVEELGSADGSEVAADNEEHVPQGHVLCEIVYGDVKSLSDEQAAAVKYLESSQDAISEVLVKNVSKVDEAIEFLAEYEVADLVNDQPMEECIRRLIACEKIVVSHRVHDGMAYMEYVLEVAWEEEHQLCVVLHGSRVIYVGDSSGGWVDEQTEGSSTKPAINPFTRKPI